MATDTDGEYVQVPNLIKVPPKNRPVVLKSGGPVMEMECVEGGNAVCSWRDWQNGNVIRRRIFPVICLYQCAPVEPE